MAKIHIMASLKKGVHFFSPFVCLFIFFKKEDHLKNGDISIYTNKIRQAAVLSRGQACLRSTFWLSFEAMLEMALLVMSP